MTTTNLKLVVLLATRFAFVFLLMVGLLSLIHRPGYGVLVAVLMYFLFARTYLWTPPRHKPTLVHITIVLVPVDPAELFTVQLAADLAERRN